MLTSTKDFEDNEDIIKHNFLEYLKSDYPELTNDRTRKKVFSDARYLINNKDLHLDFFDIISGKIVIDEYRNKLIKRFEKSNQQEPNVRHANPISRANDYVVDLNRLKNYLIKADLLKI